MLSKTGQNGGSRPDNSATLQITVKLITPNSQPVVHSREAAKAGSNLCERPQAHCADDQADENQEQARETVADPTQIEAHADDPAGRAKRDDL